MHFYLVHPTLAKHKTQLDMIEYINWYTNAIHSNYTITITCHGIDQAKEILLT